MTEKTFMEQCVPKFGWDVYSSLKRWYLLPEQLKLDDFSLMRDRVMTTGSFEWIVGHRRYIVECKRFVIGDGVYIAGYIDEEGMVFIEKIDTDDQT